MKVLLVDDHRLLLEGLTNLLNAHHIHVIGAAHDGLEAVEQARALAPDLILMDIAMPRCNGLEATRRIKARQPEIKIVMLTTSAENQDLYEAVKSGACGYLLKSASGKDLIEALHGLEEGVPPFSPGLAAKILNEFVRQNQSGSALTRDEPKDAPARETTTKLTARQTEVLRLVAEGLTYKEVGARLGLSERTVRYHMAAIMNQLHLEHRSQVIAYAGRMGIQQ